MVRKIRDLPDWRPCRSPEHNPPSMIVLPPGVYEHVCPSCGKRAEFVVPHPPTCSTGSPALSARLAGGKE